MMTPQEREQKAVEFFMAGYNCCQSVALAFSDVIGIDEEALKKLSSGFGGGVGRMREVCGAVSGMVMVAGFLSPAANPSDHAARTANYALVQDLAAAFKAEKGSIICRELLSLRQAGAVAPAGSGTGTGTGTVAPMGSGAVAPMASGATSPEPSERTAAYYHSRPCAGCVGTAARILAEKMAL